MIYDFDNLIFQQFGIFPFFGNDCFGYITKILNYAQTFVQL